MFERISELVQKCIVSYKLKAVQEDLSEEEKERYRGYAEDFQMLDKEINRLEPMQLEYKESQFRCPKCGGNLDKVCDASEELGEPLNFCPWCGQGIENTRRI